MQCGHGGLIKLVVKGLERHILFLSHVNANRTLQHSTLSSLDRDRNNAVVSYQKDTGKLRFTNKIEQISKWHPWGLKLRPLNLTTERSYSPKYSIHVSVKRVLS